MSEEFVNFEVKVTLNDGSTHHGLVTHVDSTGIALLDKNSNISTTFPSGRITDLKVLQLPPTLNKKLKGNKKSQNKRETERETPTPIPASLLDDAILYAKPSSGATLYAGSEVDGSLTDKKHRNRTPKSKNWETNEFDEEVQKIKASNEFDFIANLAMFDKKSVFADIQKNDTINPHDRLVGHNKIENVEREKYKNDEMVISNNGAKDNWDQIGASSLKETGSAIAKKNDKNKSKSAGNDNSNSKKIYKFINNESGEVIPTSSLVQLMDIERICKDNYGLDANVWTEIGAVNLSLLILNKILGGSSRLSNKKNHNLPPLVLLLIGSGKCGAKAFATGRHLTNHGVRVLGFVLNGEDSDEVLSHQWQMFESCGGKVLVSDFKQLLNIIYNELDTPVELIVDALQGYDDHLEDIFFETKDLSCLRSVMDWCNEPHQQVKVLSLDVPSGIDGGSGILLDIGMSISCQWCVSFGLPITGLIHGYKNGSFTESDIQHYLVDTGIPNKVFSKGNLRKFDRFWFSAGSAIRLQVSSE